MNQPTPKLHLIISLVKSLFRITAGVMLAKGDLFEAGSIFIFAEVLGIVEELV